jgi:putative DNA primase/helicase
MFLKPPPVTADKSTVGWSTPVKFDPPYRHGENFVARYALTFDYDHIDEFDLEEIRAAYEGVEHVEYTTWSHGGGKIRWRFVFPLRRPVNYDEFQAVSRKVADRAGIDKSARESDTPAQMMFLAAVHPAREFEWEARHVKGEWIDPDAVLASYAPDDWQDPKNWPQRKDHDVQHLEGEKVDPRNKPDPIGLFCRTFSIGAAIEKFDLPYVKTEIEGRWTFTRGSRPEGAVEFDDGLKLHSFHDTDPAHGQHNAFDLVRLHRFGAQDTEFTTDDVTALPSYKAMLEFCAVLPELRAQQVSEEFDDLGPLTDEEEQAQAEQPPERLKVKFTAGRPLGTAVEPARSAVEQCAEEIGVAVFGNRFVRPVLCSDRKGFGGNLVESVELVPYEATGLAAAMAHRIDFVRKGKPPDDGGPVPLVRVDCPAGVAKALLVSADKSPGIVIDRITMTPVLHEGVLNSTRGHNRELRAWIVAPRNMPEPGKTRAAAEAALKRILGWLEEFPLDTPLDVSSAVCAMLTAALRASIPHAPGMLVSKPDYGSGASTFCDVVHVLATGRPSAVINASAGRAEVDKAIDSVQLAGLPVIVIDNVVDGEAFNSIALAQVLTQESRQIRVLGESRVVTVPCTQVALVNGNNIKIADDLVRRFLRVRLDPHMESPHTRQFKRPTLVRDVQAARHEILSDLYTIVLSYLAADVRVPTGTLAGFGEWQRLCAEPLVWLGQPDPIETQKLIAIEDDKLANLKAIFLAWRRAFGDRAVPLKLVFDDGFAADEDEQAASTTARQELKQILTTACQQAYGRRAPKIDAVTVAMWLNGVVGRVIGGMRMDTQPEAIHGKIWSVVATEDDFLRN